MIFLGIGAFLFGSGSLDRLHAFEDEFTGGSLAPWWTIEFYQNVNDWTYDVAGGVLSVYDHTPDFWTGSGGCSTCYSIVRLRADFVAPDDFQARIKLSWDNHGTSRDMTGIGMWLFDDLDDTIAYAAYADAWIASRGSILAQAGTATYNSGPNAVGFSGTRYFEISRYSGITSVYIWTQPDESDKTLLAQGTSSDAVQYLILSTRFYPRSGSPSATFGTNSYDYVTAQALDPTLASDFIRARSGSDSCKESPGDPVDPCNPDLPPDYPAFTIRDPEPDMYEDYFTIESRSASGLQMPIQTVLKNLDPSFVYAINPDGGGDRPPTGYWTYSLADHDGTTSADDVLDLGERISKLWQIAVEGGGIFYFWVDVYTSGPKGDQDLGGFGFSPGSWERSRAAAGAGEGFILDDGGAEIRTGATTGDLVIANRFRLSKPTHLQRISFYTGDSAAGDTAEVIVYEDPTGSSSGPEPAMEVWRSTAVLGSGGFQEVPATGCPALNLNGVQDAAFYVAVANKGERNYTLGIDMTGPYVGASYVSTDGGLTFKPLSTMQIIDGNAMIRAYETPAEPCFIGEVMD